MKSVSTLGLGYIGLPTSALIASNGIKVHGVDIDEIELSIKFDEQVAGSRTHGDALIKDRCSLQNTWIPTAQWVAGYLWHYV